MKPSPGLKVLYLFLSFLPVPFANFCLRTTVLLFLALQYATIVPAQTIGTFNSVAPGVQSQSLVLPSSHTFQRIIKTGDALSMGGTLGDNLDFTGYVPISGSSTNGRLSISSESTPAQVAILDISFSATTDLWSVGIGGKVTFDPAVIGTCARFCSGTITPNNTIIVSEEDVTAGDVNGDGYIDRGWLIEIDPPTRTVINQDGLGGVDKIWALGRTNRENAAIRSDNQVLYSGADDATVGYFYKFVPTTPGNFSAGILYVLQTTSGLGNGTWRIVANTTQADRNNLRTLSTSAGGYNFNGIEDVEIAADGKIYFAAKGEGKIYRFTDNGTTGTATDISVLEVFAGNSGYPTITSYDVDGAGPFGPESWGIGNDNLAFDGQGNLWVLQDGGRNHIWMIAPTHTQASPQVKLFAKTPIGSEPTGITFTPDYRYMFLSFQHPAGTNSASQTDAAGSSVVFNTHTTVVIARTQHLGNLSILPVIFTAFDVALSGNAVKINWTVTGVSNHAYFAIERSSDGSRFEEIHINSMNINGATEHSFNYTDNDLPAADMIYYRIKQCDINGSCRYTDIKTVKINNRSIAVKQVANENGSLILKIKSTQTDNLSLKIFDLSGKEILVNNIFVSPGMNQKEIKLRPGSYVWEIRNNRGEKITQITIVK